MLPRVFRFPLSCVGLNSAQSSVSFDLWDGALGYRGLNLSLAPCRNFSSGLASLFSFFERTSYSFKIDDEDFSFP